MPLSRLYAIVSTSPLRTVTLWPTACDTSVSAAVAPPARAASSTVAATRSSSPSATESGCERRRRRARMPELGWMRRRGGHRRTLERGEALLGYHSKAGPRHAPPALSANDLRRTVSRRRDSAIADAPAGRDCRRSPTDDFRDDRRRKRAASTRCTRCRTWAKRWSRSTDSGLPSRSDLPERLVDAIARGAHDHAHEGGASGRCSTSAG